MSYLLGKPGKRRARGRRGELRTAPAALGILTAVGLATLTSVPAARADFDDLWADLFDPSAWGNLSDDFNGLFVASDLSSDALAGSAAGAAAFDFYTPLHAALQDA
ncbi:hypothetical protein, partial [Mycolicibacter sinensis]|uniref:hypothetical protein n=1 Tax=Mycolicibacter sinensis (strain JDM601) TaxID=875328 RepID=UPI000ADCE763